MTNKRAAIYLRQSIKEDEGIERQRSRCEKLVEGRGWRMLPTYEDNDTSATKPRGKGTAWMRLLADIDAGLVDVVVAVNLDRLLRGIGDLHELMRRGVQVITVEGDLDLSTETGELQATVLAGAARFEVRRRASRAAASAASRRAAGHPTSGLAAHGYRWLKEHERGSGGGRYAIVEQEAAEIRFMFSGALAGSPLASICRELNESGSRTRKGAPWRASTLRRLLISPFHAGLLPPPMPLGEGGRREHYRAELVDIDACEPGSWPAIVTVDELRAVRSRLLDPLRTTNGGSTSNASLLAALARCGVCGGAIRTATTKERYKGYRCFVGHFQRRGEQIDAYVEHVVLERLSAADASSLVRPDPGVDTASLRARKGALEGQLEQLLDLIGHGWPASKIEMRAVPIRSEIEGIDAQLSAALAIDPLASMVTSEDSRIAWEGLSLARRRAVIRELLIPIIGPVGKGVRVLTLEDAAASVAIVWRRENRRNIALPILVSEADYHPALSEFARERLSAQLS
jgi:site-specific DNA recombinase